MGVYVSELLCTMFCLFFPSLVLLNWPEAGTGTVWCESPKKQSNFWRLHLPSDVTVSTFCSCRASRAAGAVCMYCNSALTFLYLSFSFSLGTNTQQKRSKSSLLQKVPVQQSRNLPALATLLPSAGTYLCYVYVHALALPTEGQTFYSQLGDRGEYKACFTAELRHQGGSSSFLTQAF